MTEVLMWHSKKPRRLRLRGFSIPFWVGGLIPRPVSYTHLDVYKRQFQEFRNIIDGILFPLLKFQIEIA